MNTFRIPVLWQSACFVLVIVSCCLLVPRFCVFVLSSHCPSQDIVMESSPASESSYILTLASQQRNWEIGGQWSRINTIKSKGNNH